MMGPTKLIIATFRHIESIESYRIYRLLNRHYCRIYKRRPITMSEPNSPEDKKPTSATGGKRVKRQTKEEIEEEAELKRIEDERLAAEAAEEARYKHVTPLDLNKITHDPMPSLSPRDQLSYQGDKKALKEIGKFREKNPTLNRFILRLHTEILQAKPDNIVKWVDRHFFEERNVAKMRKELGIEDPDAVKASPSKKR